MADLDLLARRFSAAATANAERVAIQTAEETITYGRLAEAVELERRTLSGTPVGTPILVDLPGARTTTGHRAALTRLLAVITSGRVAVPIDGSLPEDRRNDIARLAGDDPLPGCALLMTTSGSTGTPKAVRHSPQSWAHQIDDIGEELGIGPGIRVVLALPVSFGGGMDIALGALFAGATLIPGDPRRDGIDSLLRLLGTVGADQLHLSPALMRSVSSQAGSREALAGIHLTCTCGEAPDGADIEALRRVAPQTTYINRAGSSETGNLAWNVFPPDRTVQTGTVPPGRIARGKHIVVLDDDGREVPEGQAGSLEVRSEHLALGYLVDHRPVDFPVRDGRRRHRLGDTGRVVDGELVLLGRSDDAVKIKGYLVDSSEVVAALRSLPGIDDAAVVARETAGGSKELHAYVQTAPNRQAPSPNVMRGLLGTRLPVWMQPAHIITLRELPRTERGKVDRRALPLPPDRPDYESLRTRTERILAQLWEELLSLEKIGASDDLLSLGADSLSIATLAARVETAFGLRMAPARLAATPTLREQAALIDAESTLPSGADAMELSPGKRSRRGTVFAIAGAGESALAFVPLARELSEHRVIGVQAHGLEARGVPDLTVQSAARRAARIVAESRSDGPVILAGHSLGGAIAMHAAEILKKRGIAVQHVVCLDTVLSGPLGRRSRIELRANDAPAPTTVLDDGRRRRLWRTRARLLSAGWVRRPADEQWELFYELGRRQALLYRLRPYRGALTAVLADGNPDPEEWWQRVAPEGVTVRRIAGDHNTILRPPFVTATADVIAEIVNDAGPETATPATPAPRTQTVGR